MAASVAVLNIGEAFLNEFVFNSLLKNVINAFSFATAWSFQIYLLVKPWQHNRSLMCLIQANFLDVEAFSCMRRVFIYLHHCSKCLSNILSCIHYMYVKRNSTCFCIDNTRICSYFNT